MNVQDLETKVWEIESIRIVVRAGINENVGNYNYRNAAQDTWRVTQLLDNRIKPKIGGYEVIVIEGNGEEPHGRTILRTLRNSYRRG
jgi:hypothetical protein